MSPTDLVISPSILARLWRVALHLAAALVALALPLPWRLGAWVFIVAHMLRPAAPSPVCLRVLPEGWVEVSWPGGVRRAMAVQPSGIVTSRLIVLHLRDARGGLRLAVWPDSSSQDALRQWRVWLRWNAEFGRVDY